MLKSTKATKAAICYKTSRQIRLSLKTKGTTAPESLRDGPSRPKHHPNEHQESELKLINDIYRRNQKCGLVVLWVKLRKRGYSRSISSLYRVLRKRGLIEKRAYE